MLNPDLKDLPRRHLSSGVRIVTDTSKLNTYRIALTPREALVFLVTSAREYDMTHCEVDGCEVCNEFVDTWLAVYRALTPAQQEGVDASLYDSNTPTPGYPGSPF